MLAVTELREPSCWAISALALRKEGLNEGRWALLAYGDVIVHVLMPGERGYYDLEAFWSHGESRTFLPSVK